MIVDLHTHSYYSDGVLSPKDILKKAVNAGCHFLSLTDHDSIEGLKEASICSKNLNLNFIQGVEISAKHLSKSVHIVGLGINPNNKFLLDGLMKNNKLRIDRAKEIGKSLANAGIENAYEKTKNLSKTKYITRTHFAQMIIKEKICNNLSSVFKKYMTDNKPGAVKVDWASSVEVINWIHQS